MPSTYTTRLRLTLPATGELVNTWGTTVNTGITELVDASIAGAATLSTWGGAGVPYTLSNNNGVTDEARCMFIVAAGSPGENKNIICPAVSKLYVVKNEVAGGFSVTLKTASGSGVTVENGKTAILRCTGTDVVDAITQLPAFSIAGGTVNGVVYLNASKTLTTGSALTFNGTTLANGGAADGTNAITATGNTVGGFIALRPDGTNGQAIRIGGSGAGADILRFLGTADTEYMRLNSTGLGIGTISPTAKLHVVGNQFRQNDATSSQGYVINTTSATTTLATLFGGSSFAVQTGNSGTNQLLLDASGNLGLGVTPSAWTTLTTQQISYGSVAATTSEIDVSHNAYYSSTGWKYIANGYATNHYQANGTYVWRTAPSGTAGNAISFTQAMTLDASGNLGLGVTPSAWGSNYKGFELVGGGAGIAANGSNAVTIGTGNYINSAGNWIYTTTGTAVGRYELNSGLHRWYTAPSGTAGNPISFTQAMTLDASGNLLVGTTSTGADGLGIRNTLNLTFAEGSGTSYANLFRQTSSGATVIANGYKWSNTANGFASSIGTSWAKTAIGLGVGTGAITFYTDSAGTVANGTDVTPSERARITSAGDFIHQVNGTAPSLSTNGTMSFELTSNTSLKIVVRGTDGVTRSTTLTLT